MRARFMIYFIFIFQNIGVAQSIQPEVTHSWNSSKNSVNDLIRVLREYDLNHHIQQDYSITEEEYHHLQKIWWNLLKTTNVNGVMHDVNRICGNTIVINLICDLSNNLSWDDHLKKMKNESVMSYSLTLSRFDNPISLKLAHLTLIDLLQSGPKMFENDTFIISEEILSNAEKRMGFEARYRIEKWEKLINQLRINSNTNVAKEINDFFNDIISQQIDDQEDNKYDYWQSPIETLVRGTGDCEDFVMAKYVSLRLVGIPFEEILVSLVHYPKYNDTHAVLLLFPDKEMDPLVLDNVVFEYLGNIKSHILTLSHRMIKHDINPILGFNEEKFVSFRNGMDQKLIGTDPCNEYRQFGIAVRNSNRVLP